MKRKNLVLSSTFLATIVSLPSIALSSFIITNTESNEYNLGLSDKKEAKPVAYIAGNEAVKYTSIEKALDVAKHDENSNTIYVIPGSNPTITDNCIISNGDSLIMPYEGTTYMDETRDTVKNDLFADGNLAQVKKNRKNLITVEPDVTITNYGTISIGGILGTSVSKSRQRPTGHTTGSYVEVRMNGDSSINNYGTINCYGYIKTNEYHTINDIDIQPEINNIGTNAIINLPIVIYDYKGANFAIGSIAAKTMPFNIFDFPNSQVKMTFDKDARLSTFVTLYSSGFAGKLEGVQQETLHLIGPDSTIFKSTGGSIEIKYTPCVANFNENESFTTIDSAISTNKNYFNKTQVNIKGNFEFSSTTLSLMDLLDLDTSEYNLPFSYKFDINIVSGTSTIKSKLKFLAGSQLTINKKATLNINEEAAFYTEYIDQSTYAEQLYPRSAGPSTLVNNGTLNINSSNFSGFITSTVENSVINISGDANLQTNLKELMNSSLDMKWYVNASIAIDYKNIDSVAYGYISSEPDYTNPSLATFVNNNTYYSNNNGIWYGVKGDENTIEKISNTETSDILAASVFDIGKIMAALGICIDESATLYAEKGLIKIKDIKSTDKVLTFNHFENKFEYQNVLMKFVHKAHECVVINLLFDDGNTINVINTHGFFNVEENKYVSINQNTLKEYLNKHFVVYKDKKLKIAKLIKATMSIKNIKGYAIITEKNINAICSNLLNITDLTDSLYNIFKYDKNFCYDKKDINNSINMYGYLDYVSLKNLISKETFDAFNGKYFKEKFVKKEITIDKIISYLNIFKNYYELGEVEFCNLKLL